MFLLHKVCEYFEPKEILEIGFFHGQSFGIVVDACPDDAKFTAVDISFEGKKTFDLFFENQTNMEFILTDSKNLSINNRKYDFIMVDGDHSYEYASNDISKALSLINEQGILCVDDFNMEGVWQSIREQLNGQTDWVPFLMGTQSMFFHHRSHSADYFLDHWLQKIGKDLVKHFNFNINIDQETYDILHSWVRYENIDDLIERLKKYDL
jgi:ubiquinone/menaquinone biosynthesis C-methylase UbiE